MTFDIALCGMLAEP